MSAIRHVRTQKERTRARIAGEARARTTFVQLICIVSILRTALTEIVPLAGCGAWWLTVVCMVPGALVYLLLAAGMRWTRTRTLSELVRRCLGTAGAWALSLLLTLLLLADGTATMTALITLFTEGIGTRGTQLTLALLTGGVLLTCLHREGLPRGVYLLRWVLLGAALLTAAFSAASIRMDNLFPMLGEGEPSLTAAFRAGISMAWPLLLLLTVPQETGRLRVAAIFPVMLSVLGVMLFLCLTIPHELLMRTHALADCLLQPMRYASSAVRTLAQCLLMIAFFFSVGGAALLSADFLCAPLGRAPRYLPYAALMLLTATQALNTGAVWALHGMLEPWLLLPLAAIAVLCLPIAILRRERT